MDDGKRTMESEHSQTIEIEIYGSVYRVRSDRDPEFLQEVAAIVDSRMREISKHMSSADTFRIAILAALNLADELHSYEKHKEGERVEISKRVERLSGELAEAVQG